MPVPENALVAKELTAPQRCRYGAIKPQHVARVKPVSQWLPRTGFSGTRQHALFPKTSPQAAAQGIDFSAPMSRVPGFPKRLVSGKDDGIGSLKNTHGCNAVNLLFHSARRINVVDFFSLSAWRGARLNMKRARGPNVELVSSEPVAGLHSRDRKHGIRGN